MSFFGFGGSKKPEPEPSPSYSYDSPSEPSYDYSGAGSATTSSFDEPPVRSSGATSTIENMLLEEQQRALIQQAIAKVTSIAWDKCSASKPDSELSSREVECIKNVTLAYLDASMFVVHRLNRPAP